MCRVSSEVLAAPTQPSPQAAPAAAAKPEQSSPSACQVPTEGALVSLMVRSAAGTSLFAGAKLVQVRARGLEQFAQAVSDKIGLGELELLQGGVPLTAQAIREMSGRAQLEVRPRAPESSG